MALPQEVEVLLPTLASLPMAVVASDCGGGVRWVNARFTALLGYALDEIIGRNIEMLEPGTTQNPLREILHHAATGEPWEGNSVWSRKRGDACDVWTAVTPIRDDAGSITHCLWVLTNRTDAADAAEARLQAQTRRFQRIIENTHAGYFRIGTDGRYQEVNSAWLRMCGFTRKEDAIGLHFSALQVPESLSTAEKVVDALLRGESLDGEFPRLRRDGTVGYHTYSANSVFDGDRVIGIEGFLIDITDRKTAEIERQDTEQRYRSLFNSMQEGVAIHELIHKNGAPENYVLLEVNRRYEEILGVRREDVVNKLATDVYGSQGAPYLKQYAAVVDTGTPFQFETYFPPMDKYFLISVTPMGDDRFATIFFDITEQRQTEARYRLISQNAADVIWLWDLRDGRCVYVSPSVRQLRGFSPEEVLEQPPDQTMPPDTYWTVVAEEQNRIAAVESGDEGARTRTNEVVYLCKNGTTVVTETVTKLLSDEQGKVRHVVGVIRRAKLLRRRKPTTALCSTASPMRCSCTSSGKMVCRATTWK
jgi:PAS domain S-box-containing protein